MLKATAVESVHDKALLHVCPFKQTREQTEAPNTAQRCMHAGSRQGRVGASLTSPSTPQYQCPQHSAPSTQHGSARYVWKGHTPLSQSASIGDPEAAASVARPKKPGTQHSSAIYERSTKVWQNRLPLRQQLAAAVDSRDSRTDAHPPTHTPWKTHHIGISIPQRHNRQTPPQQARGRDQARCAATQTCTA